MLEISHTQFLFGILDVHMGPRRTPSIPLCDGVTKVVRCRWLDGDMTLTHDLVSVSFTVAVCNGAVLSSVFDLPSSKV